MSAPPQPTKSDAYTAKRNPIERVPSEQAVADTPGSPLHGAGNDYMTCRRGPPPSMSEGTSGNMPNPLARGIHGADPRDYQTTSSNSHRHPLQQSETAEAEQMAPPGEGEVARAVERKSGVQHPHGRMRGEVTLEGDEADLERKKAQQSWAREEVKSARRVGVDVDGGLGGRQPHAETG
ncbi:hypothetical protein B0T25DRAFT_636346 [Lasiosphaeria hispida]|uniref:Uncharacterized protein n=1 Tax=Lasiosphaeria hispida TaxID=260671 RepID=A0AAJ0H609_9PEZI|nr:hypothetical protein B0T25DRAFT_636346 [Lasiosphaeria hispida]